MAETIMAVLIGLLFIAVMVQGYFIQQLSSDLLWLYKFLAGRHTDG